MAPRTISINRAPVLTLWATVVAERLGFTQDESLSLGRAVAALNAQVKGRRLGIYEPKEHGARQAREQKHGDEFRVELCGRPVPATNTADGVRAVSGTKVIDPGGARSYLQGKFGEHLPEVRAAMEKLAKRFRPEELSENAFTLYEQFRPSIPAGTKGWGAKGNLDLGRIESLAEKA